MNWWLKRSIGRDLQKKYEGKNSVGLIIGVTGIVGCSLAEILPLPETPGGPWKVYGVAPRPRPAWHSKHPLEYIQCDVSNKNQTVSKLSPLSDITHIFYVSWNDSKDSELNDDMFQNVLEAVLPKVPKATNLKHICLQTGIQTNVKPHDSPITEDLPRSKLENILIEKCERHGLTWTVHRPGPIFGFSPSSNMNVVASLCAYAAICKHEKRPLEYPGSKASLEWFSDAVDADLVAEHEIWASVDPNGKNQVLNCCNGDVFKWKHLWKVLAEEFKLKMVGYVEGKEQVKLQELMKDKESVWDEIVKKNKLEATKLHEFASFWIVDVSLSSANFISSMNKNKSLGFVGFRDTTKSFVSCIRKMRASKFIP